jgi:hypothetical protein
VIPRLDDVALARETQPRLLPIADSR